jgi:DNA-binding LytR/AlgR family response regulator
MKLNVFFSENKGTYIHTFDNRNYLIDSTLEVLEQELEAKDFFRISRKFIISIKAIKEIVVYSNSRLRIVLPTFKDEEVIVSREKVTNFKNWIG